jgi:hypothetical protein
MSYLILPHPFISLGCATSVRATTITRLARLLELPDVTELVGRSVASRTQKNDPILRARERAKSHAESVTALSIYVAFKQGALEKAYTIA